MSSYRSYLQISTSIAPRRRSFQSLAITELMSFKVDGRILNRARTKNANVRFAYCPEFVILYIFSPFPIWNLIPNAQYEIKTDKLLLLAILHCISLWSDPVFSFASFFKVRHSQHPKLQRNTQNFSLVYAKIILAFKSKWILSFNLFFQNIRRSAERISILFSFPSS